MNIKLFCRSILYLFGTLLHEFSHFAVALFLGKPEGFSIVPKTKGDALIFGEVRARVRYKVLSAFIGAAPLIWWAVLVVMVKHTLSVPPWNDMHELNITILMGRLRSFSLQDAFSLWLVFQLLWAGRLSTQDIKTCFGGIVSLSGLVLVASALLLVQLFRFIG